MRLLYLLTASSLIACGGGEAARVALDVTTRPLATTAVENDLGYAVSLESARLHASNLEFTVEGEEHASLWRRTVDLLVPTAHAHPGHAAGGEVTGELAGDFVLQFGAEEDAVGSATLIVGDYRGANFTFRRDPAAGHTALLEGTASRDGRTVRFTATLVVPEQAKLTGAPFELQVTSGSQGPLQVALLPAGSTSTLFDLIDFFALDSDQNDTVSITAESTEGTVLRRALQSHDFFEVTTR